MGWSGGTEIFDCVADELIEVYSSCDIPMYKVMNILSALKCTLEDQDWDTLNESTYWTHPKIGDVLGNTFEGEDDE